MLREEPVKNYNDLKIRPGTKLISDGNIFLPIIRKPYDGDDYMMIVNDNEDDDKDKEHTLLSAFIFELHLHIIFEFYFSCFLIQYHSHL